MSDSGKELTLDVENCESLREKVHTAISNLSLTKERAWSSEEIDKMIDSCFEEILILYGDKSPSNDNLGPPKTPEPQTNSSSIDKVYEYVIQSVSQMDSRVSNLEKHMEHAFQIVLKLEKLHAHNVKLNLGDFKEMLKDAGENETTTKEKQHEDAIIADNYSVIQPLPKMNENIITTWPQEPVSEICAKKNIDYGPVFDCIPHGDVTTKLPKIKIGRYPKKYLSLENSRKELKALRLSTAPPMKHPVSCYEMQQTYISSNYQKCSDVSLELNRRRNYRPIMQTSFIFPSKMVIRPRPVSYFINLTPDAVQIHLDAKESAKKMVKARPKH